MKSFSKISQCEFFSCASFTRFPLTLLFSFCLCATALSDVPSDLKLPKWWLEQAQRYAGEIEDAEVRSNSLYELAYVLGRNGDLTDATSTAEKVVKPQKRVYAQTFVAKQYLEQGNEEQFLAELQKIQQFALNAYPGKGDLWMNSHLVGAYLEAGHPEEVIQFAEEISDKTSHHSAIMAVVGYLTKQGKLEEANRLINEHITPDWQESARKEIAFAAAGAGHIEDANAAIPRFTNEEDLDKTYAILVNALIKAGRTSEAKQFAQKIVDPIQQATALSHIETQLAQKEGKGTLKSRIENVTTREVKLALSEQLFGVLIEQKNMTEAEDVIEAMIQIVDDNPREEVRSKFGNSNDDIAKSRIKSLYLKTALLLAEQGNKPAALKRIVWARKAILQMPAESGVLKMMLLPELVATQIKAGDLSGARELLNSIENELSRSQSAQQLAIALIQAKEFQAATEVTEQITYSLMKGRAIGAVAGEWIRAGELGRARDLLDKSAQIGEDIQAYREVGKVMIERDLAEELQNWAIDMPPSSRAYACMGAAEGLNGE